MIKYNDKPATHTARQGAAFVAFIAWLLMCGAAYSQTLTQTLPPQPASQSSGAVTPLPATDSDSLAQQNAMARNTMSARQIISLLEEKPEVMVELKSQVSDYLQKQGALVDSESITDEMVYSKISSSLELRSNITTFLRARGYVTEADVQRNSSDSTDNDYDDSFPLAQSPQVATQLQLQGLDPSMAAALGAAAGMNSPGFAAGTNDSAAAALSRTVGSPGVSPQSSSLGSYNSASGGRNTSNTTPGAAPAEPQVLHRPTPYNLLSMRDLYTQLPELSAPLKRFSSEVFLNRARGMVGGSTAASLAMPLDVPIGPSYVLGPGDSLAIDLWGGISQSFTRVIDREGKIVLPEAGAVQVAGLTLARAQDVIDDLLKQQYRNVQIAVTVARLRTFRVYVVGDVQRPGAYDISSLSTPLNALYAAGGPTAVGSLRVLQHYRGSRMIGDIDLYDFLLHGVRDDEGRLEAGDTLLVPPAGPQVAIFGSVKRPAIYELKGESSLLDILTDAGGSTVAAELSHIVVDRIGPSHQRETITLGLTAPYDSTTAHDAMAAFKVQDGDRIRVSTILPYSSQIVYLDGHVVRPGRTAYHDGMHLSDVLHSYQDMLPEPAELGEIIRLVPPDLHPETINFNISEVLIGNDNPVLEPFDTVRVFGRYETDAPKVTIRGEVLRPGAYPLSQGMTAAQLVRMAGGFKRDAFLKDADLTSYQIVDGTRVVSNRTSLHIGDEVKHQGGVLDVPLKAGDVLTVHQITGWEDIGASIMIEGEVAHPGSYGFQEGERLSSVLRRAGGFIATSYPAGAVLIRDQVRELEERSRQQLIHQIETSSAAARLASNVGPGDQSSTLQLVQAQQEQILSRLKSQPATGRLVIHVTSDISSWENTPADIEVRAGDVLRIPKRPGFVLVSGQVYNSSAITFVPGKTAGWYLKHAGGASEVANKKEIFIIRANGSVIGRGSGSVLATQMEPGDVVVVPQKIIGASVFWRNLLTVAQVASSIALTALVAGL